MNNQVITVEELFPAKEGNNPDYVTMQLRTTLDVESTGGGAGAAVSQLLGGANFTTDRVAFQSIHKDILKEAGVSRGDDLNSKFEIPFKIAISEMLDSDFNKLDEEAQLGYSKKIHPETKAELTVGGEAIWRKTYLADAETADVKVKHDKVSAEKPALKS